MRTGAYVWGGVRDGVVRSWSDTCRGTLSFFVGDPSRIAASFDGPPDVAALAALLPFLSCNLAICFSYMGLSVFSSQSLLLKTPVEYSRSECSS